MHAHPHTYTLPDTQKHCQCEKPTDYQTPKQTIRHPPTHTLSDTHMCCQTHAVRHSHTLSDPQTSVSDTHTYFHRLSDTHTHKHCQCQTPTNTLSDTCTHTIRHPSRHSTYPHAIRHTNMVSVKQPPSHYQTVCSSVGGVLAIW